jgi:hypothetical protein
MVLDSRRSWRAARPRSLVRERGNGHYLAEIQARKRRVDHIPRRQDDLRGQLMDPLAIIVGALIPRRGPPCDGDL